MTRRRPGSPPVPSDMGISERIRPSWNEKMTLHDASASLSRLARFEPGVIAELPRESILRIEINGEFAGAVHCFPDAPAELALGWAFIHGFFQVDDPVDSVTVDDNRVSLMIATSTDIARQRDVAAGWTEAPGLFADSVESARPASVIHADVLMDVVREAFAVMEEDRAQEGFVHAAVISDSGVHCVARDREPTGAVAKLVGWMLSAGGESEASILVLRGIVDRQIVETTDRLGLSVIAASGILTAEALREAEGRQITVLGLARSKRPGIFVDGGHIVEDESEPIPKE